MESKTLIDWAWEQGPFLGLAVTLIVLLYKRTLVFGWMLEEDRKKAAADILKTEQHCAKLEKENAQAHEIVKVSVIAAAEAAATTKRSVEALDQAREVAAETTRRAVEALEETRNEYLRRLEALNKQRN
jgi:hypothetical protein